MNIYSKTKNIILKIIPKKILFRYEYAIRYLYYLKFAGGKYQCNICNKKIRTFVNTNNDKLCPRCGSIARTRRLWQIISNDFLKNKPKILDFSPSRSIYRLMKKENCDYISSDLSDNFISDVAYNIKNIDAKNESFDLIICYHILEHIDDDAKAISELWRVLKKNSYCLIQTPFKEGEIYENSSIKLAKDRKIHFGQEDHVRIYSANGLTNRLKKAGFKVKTMNYKENNDNIHGFKSNETVLICHK